MARLAALACAMLAASTARAATGSSPPVIHERFIPPAAARVGFAGSEQAWLRYRNASCVAVASVYAGGTARPVAYGLCVGDRNRTHLVDLRDLKNALRTH